MIAVYACVRKQGITTEETVPALAKNYAELTGNVWEPGTSVCRTERGKPYFCASPLHFSVSHSGRYWACAFYTAALGMDLQEHRSTNPEPVARRFFHPEERKHLEESGFTDFFDLWAAKESYVKYTGTGISDSFSGFSVLGGGPVRFYPIPFMDGYSLCVCIGPGDAQPDAKVIWFD